MIASFAGRAASAPRRDEARRWESEKAKLSDVEHDC